MSSPTAGPEPHQPQGGAPDGPTGWSPSPPPPPAGYGNPASPYGGGPAGYGPADQRPPHVTAAAVLGLVIGGLGTVGGLLSLAVIGTVFSVSVILGVLALLSLIVAIMMLAGGIQAMRGQSPRLLLQASIASIVVQLLYAILAIVYGEAWFTGLLGFVLPILILVLLRSRQARQYYAARGQSY